jgi:hypothetical protein
MMDFLSPLGYTLYHLVARGPKRVEESFDVPGKHANFLAVAIDRHGSPTSV